MSNNSNLVTTFRQILTEEARDKKDLVRIAERIANETCRSINNLTPITVTDMPYARQYTLEKVIGILKVRV